METFLLLLLGAAAMSILRVVWSRSREPRVFEVDGRKLVELLRPKTRRQS